MKAFWIWSKVEKNLIIQISLAWDHIISVNKLVVVAPHQTLDLKKLDFNTNQLCFLYKVK